MTTETTALTTEQNARVEALRAARDVLGRRPGLLNAEPAYVEPTDLHTLAVFILDGGDPWLDNVTRIGIETGAPLYDREDLRLVVTAALDDLGRRLAVPVAADDPASWLTGERFRDARVEVLERLGDIAGSVVTE